MRTIGRRLREDGGPDRVAVCSYCGVQWLRSQLSRDASQNLACPDCAPGLDVVSLTEGNARLMRSRQPKTVGPSDGNWDQFVCPPAPPFIDPNGGHLVRTINTGPTGPLSVPVYMWLRGDSAKVADGTTSVVEWTDISNRGNSVPATTVAARPTLTLVDATLGGLPTVTANGITQWLETANFTGGAPLWLWVIRRINAVTGATQSLFTSGFGLLTNLAGDMALRSNSGVQAPAVPGIVSSWQRDIVVFNAAGTDSLQVAAALSSYASAGQRYSAATSIFAAPGGGSRVSGSIAEVLLTGGSPAAAEIAAIEAYGMARYGGGPFA